MHRQAVARKKGDRLSMHTAGMDYIHKCQGFNVSFEVQTHKQQQHTHFAKQCPMSNNITKLLQRCQISIRYAHTRLDLLLLHCGLELPRASRPPRCRCSSSSHDQQLAKPQGADGVRQCQSTDISGATWQTNHVQAQTPEAHVASMEARVRLSASGMHIRRKQI